jgi:hypothetical protein
MKKRARVIGWAALCVIVLLLVVREAFRQRPGELVTIRVIDADTHQPLKSFQLYIVQRITSLPLEKIQISPFRHFTLQATNGEMRVPLRFDRWVVMQVVATNHEVLKLSLMREPDGWVGPTAKPGEQMFSVLEGWIGKTNLLVIPLPRLGNHFEERVWLQL